MSITVSFFSSNPFIPMQTFCHNGTWLWKPVAAPVVALLWPGAPSIRQSRRRFLGLSWGGVSCRGRCSGRSVFFFFFFFLGGIGTGRWCWRALELVPPVVATKIQALNKPPCGQLWVMARGPMLLHIGGSCCLGCLFQPCSLL